jgi:branched-chain amino acid transport system permease protein
MDFFLALVMNGLLSGSVYALVGMAFVVVYRASLVLNFSLGEWVSLGAKSTGVSVQVLGLPLIPAAAAAIALMAALAIAFNRAVIAKLIGRPIVAVVMATLALGVLMRAGAALTLTGLPSAIPIPFEGALWVWGPVIIPPSRVLSSGVALLLVVAMMVFFRVSRAGIAIRAVADDAQAATGAGISITRYLALAWALSAGLCVAGGVLWSIDGLGGFGMGLVLAKVLPVVVIGGLTSFPGTIVGAVIVGLAESLAAGYLDPVIGTGSAGVVAAMLVIITLWLRPAGLFGAHTVSRV